MLHQPRGGSTDASLGARLTVSWPHRLAFSWPHRLIPSWPHRPWAGPRSSPASESFTNRPAEDEGAGPAVSGDGNCGVILLSVGRRDTGPAGIVGPENRVRDHRPKLQSGSWRLRGRPGCFEGSARLTSVRHKSPEWDERCGGSPPIRRLANVSHPLVDAAGGLVEAPSSADWASPPPHSSFTQQGSIAHMPSHLIFPQH